MGCAVRQGARRAGKVYASDGGGDADDNAVDDKNCIGVDLEKEMHLDRSKGVV